MSAMSAADWKRGTAAMLENLKRKGHNFRIERYSGRYRLTQILPDGSLGRHAGPMLTRDRLFWFLAGFEEMASKVAWDDAQAAKVVTETSRLTSQLTSQLGKLEAFVRSDPQVRELRYGDDGYE